MKKELRPRKLRLTRETLVKLTDLGNVAGGSHTAELHSKLETLCASDTCPTRQV